MSDDEKNPQSSKSLQPQEIAHKPSGTVPLEERVSAELDSGIVVNLECCKDLCGKICSLEGLKNPVVLNISLSIVLGLPLFILFMAYVGDILRFVIRHDTFFQIAGGFIKLLGKIVYFGAFLPLGTLYKFAIGTLDIDSNALVAVIYQLISVFIEVLAFLYHRYYGKLPDAQELERIKAKLEMFRQATASDGNGRELPVSFFRKAFEIFCIQNAWVPDTGTMLYFATATNWSVWVFLWGTLASGLTLGLVKTIAWMIALRAIMEDIQQDDSEVSAWDLLEGLSIETSLLEQIFIYVVGVGGVIFIVYRCSMFLWLFCLRREWEKHFERRCSEDSSHMLQDVGLTSNISQDL